MKHIFYKAGTAVTALVFSASACMAQHSGFKTAKTFHIKSAGGWDYLAVSPTTNYLYVSHGSQVNILNKTTGDSVGVFQHTLGVHGIAFAPEFDKGFISNGRLNNVYVFNARTNQVTDSIATGINPDAMCYDPFSKKLFVGNGRSSDITVIDAATNKVVGTIPLGGKPEAGVSDEQGRVYINLEDKNEIAVIDTRELNIVNHFSVAPGDEPAGLAIDNKTHHLFSGCGNKELIVVDAATGSNLVTLPIGDHCDGVAFDTGTGNAYAANGDGTLTVIHETGIGTYKVTGTATTKRGARTIAVDPKTHWIYLPTAEFEPQKTDVKERPKMIGGTFQVLVLQQN